MFGNCMRLPLWLAYQVWHEGGLFGEPWVESVSSSPTPDFGKPEKPKKHKHKKKDDYNYCPYCGRKLKEK